MKSISLLLNLGAVEPFIADWRSELSSSCITLHQLELGSVDSGSAEPRF